VKSVFQNDYRRFNLEKPSYDLLVRTIAQSYDNLKPGFVVKYVDDEGDMCHVSSDVELAEAFNVASDRLKVVIEGESTGKSTPPEEVKKVPQEVKAPLPAEIPKASPPPEVEDEDDSDEAPIEDQKAESQEPEAPAQLPSKDELISLVVNFVKDEQVQRVLPNAAVPAAENKNDVKPQNATFVRDATFPDGSHVVAGQTLIKEWEVQNTGSEKWKEGCKLIFVEGERSLLSEVEEFAVPLAEPGQKVILSLELNVPSSLPAGVHKITFQIADADRNPIGDRYWAELEVAKEEQKEKKQEKPDVKEVKDVKAAPAPTPTPAPVSSPAPVSPPASVQKPEQPKLETPFKEQLEELTKMGFVNQQLNVYFLNKSGGDLEKALNWLIDLNKFPKKSNRA